MLAGGRSTPNQPRTEATMEEQTEQEQRSTSSSDVSLDDLVPWCGVGCLMFAAYFDFPSCFGGRIAGDILCCTVE
jgi:hypothetical protein